jgi:hypothetical protein
MNKEYEKMEEEDWGCFQLMSNEALINIATRVIDVQKVVKEMLQGRGAKYEK